MKLAEQRETNSTIRFSAKLMAATGSEKSAAVIAARELARAGLASGELVEGTINAFPFRAAVESDSAGNFHLKITKALRKAAEAEVGDDVRVEITRVGDELEVRPPAELIEGLAANAKARSMWVATTPLARRDWILWITSARQDQTRLSRIEKAVDMLAHGKRRVCCFGGLNWLTKDHPAAETWLPLKSAAGKKR